MKKYIFTLISLLVVVNLVSAEVFCEIQNNDLYIKNYKIQKNKSHNLPVNHSENKITNFSFLFLEKDYKDKNRNFFIQKNFIYDFSKKTIKGNIGNYNNILNFNILFLLTNQQRK